MLSGPQRRRCMDLVCAVESTLLRVLAPRSINLAALGNVVPHLHWHVVARFEWDSHFPNPIWGPQKRRVRPSPAEHLSVDLAELDAAVTTSLSQCAAL